MHQPPLTDKYEKMNFHNMNIFSKIQALPNYKNKKLTEQIRRIVRNKDKIDPQYFLINPKLIQKTKDDIDKDFYISNYRFKAANRNKKLNNALFELNMKRQDQKLELVEEDYKENDTEIYSSPKRREFTPGTHKLSSTGFYGYHEDQNLLEKRVLPHCSVTSNDIIKNSAKALEALNLEDEINSNFNIREHVQQGQKLTIKNYHKRIKYNPYLHKYQRSRRQTEDDYSEKKKGILDMSMLRHERSKARVKKRDEIYLMDPNANQSFVDSKRRRIKSSSGQRRNQSFNIRGAPSGRGYTSR